MDGIVPVKKASRGSWLLWWKIDPDELDWQATHYRTVPFRESMRGISVLFLVVSMAITVALAFFGALGVGASAYVDVAILGVLAVFIYFGHRWAMIAAMMMWTLEKIAAGLGSPVMAVSQLLWWAVYMHAFYFAFRIEQRRRALPPETDVEVFS